MITVSEKAIEKLRNYLQENNVTASIRIALMQGGCSGATLGMAVDDINDSDITTSFDELTFFMEKNLLEQCGSISVDFIEAGSKSGFSITSANPVPGANAGCKSGSCGTNGCGC